MKRNGVIVLTVLGLAFFAYIQALLVRTSFPVNYIAASGISVDLDETYEFLWVAPVLLILTFCSGTLSQQFRDFRLAQTYRMVSRSRLWAKLITKQSLTAASLFWVYNCEFVVIWFIMRRIADPWAYFQRTLPQLCIATLGIILLAILQLAISMWINDTWALLVVMAYSLICLSVLAFIPKRVAFLFSPNLIFAQRVAGQTRQFILLGVIEIGILLVLIEWRGKRYDILARRG